MLDKRNTTFCGKLERTLFSVLTLMSGEAGVTAGGVVTFITLACLSSSSMPSSCCKLSVFPPYYNSLPAPSRRQHKRL